MITARDFERLQQVAQDLEQYGGAVVPCKADAAREKDAEAVVDRALEAFGRLDILVNNAGISAVAEAETMSSVQWQSVIDTNLTGFLLLLRAKRGAARCCAPGRARSSTSHPCMALAPPAVFPRLPMLPARPGCWDLPASCSRGMGAARTECRGIGSRILPFRPDHLGF